MLKRNLLALFMSCFIFGSLQAITPTQNPFSDDHNYTLKVSEACAFLKENIFEFLMSSFQNDESDSITTYTITSMNRFLGGVTVLKLSKKDYVFIPILPSLEASNPMWAVDLFNLISEYTGIREFLIPFNLFKSKAFSFYANGYIDVISSPSDDWVLVNSRPCDLSLYTIKNINDESDTYVKLRLLESIITDAERSLPLKLKALKDLRIDYDRYYLTFIDKRSSLFGASELQFEDVSLFDYLEASTYLIEDYLEDLSFPYTSNRTNSDLYPISSFYIDLIENELVSPYDVYSMLFNRFFAEPPSISFNTKHELGLDVLNEVFFGLSSKKAEEFKGAFILLNGPSLSIITLDTIPIYLQTSISFKKFTTENLYEYTDSLNQESIYEFFVEATDFFTASKLKTFFNPRHRTLNIILHKPDPLSMIWITSTFESIARVSHFNPMDIYNIVTVLSLLEKTDLTPFSNIQAVNMVESINMIIRNLTIKYPNPNTVPHALKKLISKLERYKQKVLDSGSDDYGCQTLFIFGG